VSAARAKGTKWETAIVEHLRSEGWPGAERRALLGGGDRGDIAGIVGVVIEAKNCKQARWGEWLDEARRESANASASVGVVWAHRVGRASPGEGFVVMTGATFLRLLKDAGYQ
jgi:hypothetical protein